MAEKGIEAGGSSFATVHRAPGGLVLPKGTDSSSVPGLLKATLVRDAYVPSVLLICTWESKGAFDAGSGALLTALGKELVLEEWGHAESLCPPPRWRKAWKRLSLTSSHFLALLLGCVTIIATCNSIRDSYGAFLAKPEATFRDASVTALDPSRPPHDLLVGEAMPIAFTLTHVGMSRGSRLVARAESIEKFSDAEGALAGVDWDPETTAHLPLVTGASHAFRAILRASDVRLAAPQLCRIRAWAEIAAGEWRDSARISTETTVRIWPVLEIENHGPRESLADPTNSVLWLEVHVGRAATAGLHVRVTLEDGAPFRLLGVRGAAPDAVWPPSERQDRLEWNVPPQPSFRSLPFGLAAKRVSLEDERTWAELAGLLKIDCLPVAPDPPRSDTR